MEKSTVRESAQLTANVIVKCWLCNDFKARLKEDPRKTLEEFLGRTLSHSASISVLEESQDQYYLVIPRNPKDFLHRDLTEIDLARMAGTECDATDDDTGTNNVNCFKSEIRE